MPGGVLGAQGELVVLVGLERDRGGVVVQLYRQVRAGGGYYYHAPGACGEVEAVLGLVAGGEGHPLAAEGALQGLGGELARREVERARPDGEVSALAGLETGADGLLVGLEKVGGVGAGGLLERGGQEGVVVGGLDPEQEAEEIVGAGLVVLG